MTLYGKWRCNSSGGSSNSNTPPQITSIENKKIYVGEGPLSFNVEATDDGQIGPLTYSLGSGAPSNASIGEDGTFYWYPSVSQPLGIYTIVIQVSDGENISSESFVVNVMKNQYTVAFQGNGGSETDPITADFDSLITAPVPPTKPGYEFAGWYKDSELLTEWCFESDTIPSHNILLFAKWIIKEYTVTFEDYDETVLKEETVEYGSGATAPTAPTREGHTFTGWDIDYSNITDNLRVIAQYNVNQYTVTFDSNGGSAIDSITTDFASLITAPVPPTQNGYKFVGWYKDSGLTIAWNFDSDTVPSENMTLYGKWRRNSSGGSSNSNNDLEHSDTEEKVGEEIVTEESGEEIVKYKVDSVVINKKMEEAIKAQENIEVQQTNVIEVSITAQDAKKITTTLSGDIVKTMDENNVSLSIKSKDINYILPANEVEIDNIAKKLGVGTDNLIDIEIEIEINKLDENLTKLIEERALKNGLEIIFPPISFEVVAKVKTVEGVDKQVIITKFNHYVQRVMKLPDDVDPTKITGTVYNEDGTFSPVPTSIFMSDGIYYAKINSLTNSSYLVVYNPITVNSVENHWSKEAVNALASMLVIKDPEMFVPNQEITRGEFLEYIAKALGIYRTGETNSQKFLDVDAVNEFADAVELASEYGIIMGYPDGSFKPHIKITREEAMVMYSRAMNIIGLEVEDYANIESYMDKAMVVSWAYNDVKNTLNAGIFNEKTAETIHPKGPLTYAEAATAIRNLLFESFGAFSFGSKE